MYCCHGNTPLLCIVVMVTPLYSLSSSHFLCSQKDYDAVEDGGEKTLQAKGEEGASPDDGREEWGTLHLLTIGVVAMWALILML